jgi:PTS system galactitol-specific IIA component
VKAVVIEAKIFKEDLVFTDMRATSAEELLTDVGKSLVQLGYVKESFIPAILEREKNYPTGLELNGFNVGIPHTDSIHINHPFIAVVKNDKKIPVIHMATDDKEVWVNCFFVLGIKDPENQIELLQVLMDKFNDQTFIAEIKKIQDKQQMIAFLKNTF